MGDSSVEQEEIQEKTEIWKQIIITAGVVIVAVIGAWQAIAIVKLNSKPASAAPPAAATSLPVAAVATYASSPTSPAPATFTPTSPAPTDTTVPTKAIASIDTSHWYQLTNDSPGASVAIDLDPYGQPVVDTPNSVVSGQKWRFVKSTAKGYYNIVSQVTGVDWVFNIIARSSDWRPTITAAYNTDTDADWTVTGYGDNCYRLATKLLGDGSSLELMSNGSTMHMAQTSDTAPGQCWHLTAAGPIN